MVVCICNCLNDEDIKKALETCQHAHEVHSACDCEVQCGCCLQHIEELCQCKD